MNYFGSREDGKKKLLTFFFTWLLIILSIYALIFFNDLDFRLVSIKKTMSILAGGIIILGYLLIPEWNVVTNRLFVLVWSFCLSFAFVIIVKMNSPELQSVVYLSGSLAVFLISCFLLSLSRAMFIWRTKNKLIPWAILSAFLMLTAIPVWLGPWVELLATTPEKLHSVIWGSPLTYLATVLDYDYLRSQWFYQHTPYGMFRYQYPSSVGFHLFVAGISLLLLSIKNKPAAQPRV